MITVNRTIYTKEVKEIDILNGVCFLEVEEDKILSKIKLDLNDEGYKFTRIVDEPNKKAIIYKEGSKTLPWVLEKYFTEQVTGQVITEEIFENAKSELLKQL